MNPPFGPIVLVVAVYGWGEQTRRSVTLPSVPSNVPARSPMRPNSSDGSCADGCCSDGAAGVSAGLVRLSLEVQLTPAVSSNARPINENLRSQLMEPLPGQRVRVVRRYRDRETTAAEQSAVGPAAISGRGLASLL